MEGDNLEFGTSKSRNAKQGRRAAVVETVPPSPAVDIEQDDDLSTPVKQNVTNAVSAPDRPTKAVSGWGEDAPRKPRARQLGEGFEASEDERLRPRSPDKNEDDNSDNDIPVIPELEDQQEEDIVSRIATAPNVAVNRVATYRELDNDLQQQAVFQTLDNEIDLKLLTKALTPLEDLNEEDLPWDWDRLFTEVSSELTTEWEKTEQADLEQTEAS